MWKQLYIIQLSNRISSRTLHKTKVVIDRIINNFIIQKFFSDLFDAKLSTAVPAPQDLQSRSKLLHTQPIVGVSSNTVTKFLDFVFTTPHQISPCKVEYSQRDNMIKYSHAPNMAL